MLEMVILVSFPSRRKYDFSSATTTTVNILQLLQLCLDVRIQAKFRTYLKENFEEIFVSSLRGEAYFSYSV